MAESIITDNHDIQRNVHMPKRIFKISN